MKKKLFCIILSAIFSFGILSGCTLFEHNDEKDIMQTIITVEPITETREGKPTFTSEKKTVYKMDLLNQLNQQGSSMIQQGMTIEQVVKQLVDGLVNKELILIEADRLIHFGDIKWGLTQENDVKKLVYGSIDAQLKSIRDEILKEYDEPTVDKKEEEPETKTTYPIQEVESNADDKEDVKEDTEVWSPDKTVWPGLYGDSDQKSLERESVRRIVKLFEDRGKEDLKATKADKAKFAEDKKKIDAIIADKSKGIEAVYPMLSETHYVKYFVEKLARQQIQVEQLQKYIEDSVTVDEDEVFSKFSSQQKAQKTEYQDVAKYKAAIEGDTTVLYHPNNDYVSVKHILVPFSDKQKAELKSIQDSKKYSDAQIKEIRNSMAQAIVSYPHKNGEDDKSRPMTIAQIYNDIYSTVVRHEASVKESERAFTDMIYKYNTDPGMFTKTQGYAVKEVLGEGEAETFMKEFAEAARKLKKEYRVGQMLPEYVITDYGVHLMYYMSDITTAPISIRDYQTFGEYKTYFDVMKKEVKDAKANEAFKVWQDEKITYYKNAEVNKKKVVTIYDSRYQDVIDKNKK